MTDDSFQLGAHVSIAGGVHLAVERAAALKCTTFQIFPSNPRGWRQKTPDPDEVSLFRREFEHRRCGSFFVHMPYLPNLASPDDVHYEKSVAALVDAVEKTAVLGGRYVVTHLGSHKGAGAAAGRDRAAAAIRRTVRETRGTDVAILIENSAGKSNQMGTSFRELTTLYRKIGTTAQRRVALCVDTCHAHAMAYDLSADGDGLARLLAEVDDVIGVDMIKLLHLNDAKEAAGSGLDRHEHIGRGTIGREGFKKIINHPLLRRVPMVLETPQDEGWDKKNLNLLRRLRKTIDNPGRNKSKRPKKCNGHTK